MTHRSTCDGSTSMVDAMVEYGSSCPMFWKARVVRASKRMVRSNWTLSRSTDVMVTLIRKYCQPIVRTILGEGVRMVSRPCLELGQTVVDEYPEQREQFVILRGDDCI